MKLKTIKLLVLALVLISCISIVACVRSNPGNTDDQLPPVSIVADGATEYKIVRADEDTTLVKVSTDLQDAIQKKYGLKIALGTDMEGKFDPDKRHPYEILVGYTNRDESIAAFDSLNYNDYVIKVSGSKVVILGGNSKKTVEAVEYFIDHYLTEDKLELEGNLCFTLPGKYENIKLLGNGIADYKLVSSRTYNSYASIMANEIGSICGVKVPVAKDAEEATEKEIIIGSSNRGANASWGYDDYSIMVEGNKIYIDGGSEYAVGSGCRKLLNILKASNGELGASDLNVDYILPDRQEYIDDISKLAMHWDIYFETPEWMLDFEEKIAATNDPNGRIMSSLHRGDQEFYPENSIEGFISAIRMGADMIETDPRLTKDGVLVLLHDETLTRMTNVKELAGKNGLPTSYHVEDWTYEQLQQLSLKQGNGGDKAILTGYKIPTFEETMKVCANRIYIRLDRKGDSSHALCWNYENDVWPLMQKYNTYVNVIFTWHGEFTSNNYAKTKAYKALMVQACGRSAPLFIGMTVNSQAAMVLNDIKKYELDKCVYLADAGFVDMTMTEYLKKASSILSVLRGKTRVYGAIEGPGFKYETPECYAELYRHGFNYFFVNKGLQMCQYISENFTATGK